MGRSCSDRRGDSLDLVGARIAGKYLATLKGLADAVEGYIMTESALDFGREKPLLVVVELNLRSSRPRHVTASDATI